jgi:hypothetical protein
MPGGAFGRVPVASDRTRLLRGMPDLPPLFTDSAFHNVITSRDSAPP